MYERNNDNPKEYDRGRNKQIGEVCREAKRANSEKLALIKNGCYFCKNGKVHTRESDILKLKKHHKALPGLFLSNFIFIIAGSNIW